MLEAIRLAEKGDVAASVKVELGGKRVVVCGFEGGGGLDELRT